MFRNMAQRSTVFESGKVYQCVQDTHLIDYKLTKMKSRYRLTRRAIMIKKGDIILCLQADESKFQTEAVLLVGEEIIHIQEHNSTLRALTKALVAISR